MKKDSHHLLTLSVIKTQINSFLSTAESRRTIHTQHHKTFEDMLKERVLESVNQIRSDS